MLTKVLQYPPLIKPAVPFCSMLSALSPSPVSPERPASGTATSVLGPVGAPRFLEGLLGMPGLVVVCAFYVCHLSLIWRARGLRGASG